MELLSAPEELRDDCGISYGYASKLNRYIKNNWHSSAKNFSYNTPKELLSAPEDLAKEIVGFLISMEER